MLKRSVLALAAALLAAAPAYAADAYMIFLFSFF